MKFLYKMPGPILCVMGAFFLSYGGLLVKSFEGSDLWLLSFALKSAEDASREVTAEEVWGALGSDSGSDDRLPELFLSELDRAAMLYPKLETSLEESTLLILLEIQTTPI